MAIKNWHMGKIILLWIWGIVLMGLSLQFIKTIENFILGFLLISVIVGLPVALSVMTWKWFSGKEQ